MTAPSGLRVRGVDGGAGEVCRDILSELPAWFGIPEANDDYVAVADRETGAIAEIDGRPVGIATIVQHGPHSAEVHLMAVRPAWHGHGVGSAMLCAVEGELARGGVEYLQVKTLSPRHPDSGYARTRAFYAARGFRVLEEFPDLWGEANPALMLVKSVTR